MAATIHQKLQEDLNEAKLALHAAREKLEPLKMDIAVHEAKVKYILDLQKTLKTPQKYAHFEELDDESNKSEDEDARSSATADAVIGVLREAGGTMRLNAIVGTGIAQGAAGNLATGHEKFKNNVASYLRRASKQTEKTGIKKVGHGRFKYVGTNNE